MTESYPRLDGKPSLQYIAALMLRGGEEIPVNASSQSHIDKCVPTGFYEVFVSFAASAALTTPCTGLVIGFGPEEGRREMHLM